jgi:hypothetical protein
MSISQSFQRGRKTKLIDRLWMGFNAVSRKRQEL